jgi:hypothetical protein
MIGAANRPPGTAHRNQRATSGRIAEPLKNNGPTDLLEGQAVASSNAGMGNACFNLLEAQ